MTGELYIDGVDAYTEWGLSLTDGCLGRLMQMPPFKVVETNDWHEDNGVEVELSAPVLAARTLQLEFALNYNRDSEDFLFSLIDGAYHTFTVTRLASPFVLRYVRNDGYTWSRRPALMTITFALDTPPTPVNSGFPLNPPPDCGVSMDDHDLNSFGLRLLQGTNAEVRRYAAAKTNLARDLNRIAGLDYDGYNVVFSAKDITLSMLIHTATIQDYLNRWNTLFYYITLPGLRRFNFNSLGRVLTGYYKSNDIKEFVSDWRGIWCKFTVTFTITDWQPMQEYSLLAAEDDSIIESEDTEIQTFIKTRLKLPVYD